VGRNQTAWPDDHGNAVCRVHATVNLFAEALAADGGHQDRRIPAKAGRVND